MSRPNHLKAIDQELEAQTNALVTLDRREGDLDSRVGAIEGKLRTNQVETAVERGLPADLVTAESNVWKRLTLTHQPLARHRRLRSKSRRARAAEGREGRRAGRPAR